MPKCKLCHRATITGTRSDGSPIALDAVPLTYVYLETAYPVEGGRVSLSGALVNHESVCPVALRQHEQQQRTYRTKADTRSVA
jgi:hypothetical protein